MSTLKFEPPRQTTVLLAALRDEMDPVAKALGMTARGPLRHQTVHGQPVTAIITGMGAARMTAALEQAIRSHQPGRIILLGFSGALAPSLKAGDVVHASCIFDQHGGRIALDDAVPRSISANTPADEAATVLTTDRIVCEPRDKDALHQQHRAAAVDMESFHVAKMAMEHRVPLTILRAISDPADFALPARIGEWVNDDGSPSVRRVIGALLRQPSLLPTLLKLRHHTKAAASRLAAEVKSLLDETGARSA